VELEDYGGGLRPLTASRIDPAIALAVEVLAGWGVALTEGRSEAPDLADAAIRRGAYESGRPSAEEACRIGDDRFLPGAR
jgi:hydrogenase maturation protease